MATKNAQPTNDAFDAAHGGDGVMIGRWLVFPDGACRTDTVQMGPPVDKAELHRQIMRYHEARMAEADAENRRNNATAVETPAQRVSRFDHENGNDAVAVEGWLLFSNGARREQQYGALIGPPADPYELCRLQLRYHEQRLLVAAKQFEEKKAHLTTAAHYARQAGYPPPDAEALAALTTLQKEVRRRQRAVDAARAALVQNTPASRLARDAAVAAARDEAQAFIEKVSSIRL